MSINLYTAGENRLQLELWRELQLNKQGLKMFNGYARKVAFPLVAMVAIGWLLIIIGFGIETAQEGAPADGSLRYSWWMVILLTPFMLIMAVVQAAIDNSKLAYNIIGAIITLLSALFLTALGLLLNFYGIRIDQFTKFGLARIDSVALQFSGSFIAGVFWVALMCVTHFYKRDDPLAYLRDNSDPL